MQSPPSQTCRRCALPGHQLAIPTSVANLVRDQWEKKGPLAIAAGSLSKVIHEVEKVKAVQSEIRKALGASHHAEGKACLALFGQQLALVVRAWTEGPHPLPLPSEACSAIVAFAGMPPSQGPSCHSPSAKALLLHPYVFGLCRATRRTR